MSNSVKFVQGTTSYNTGYFAPGQPTGVVMKHIYDVNIHEFRAIMTTSGSTCSIGNHSRFEFDWNPGDGVTDDMVLEIQEVYDGAITGSGWNALSVTPLTQARPYGDVTSIGGYDDGTSTAHTVTYLWRLYQSGVVDLQATSSYTQTIHNECAPP